MNRRGLYRNIKRVSCIILSARPGSSGLHIKGSGFKAALSEILRGQPGGTNSSLAVVCCQVLKRYLEQELVLGDPLDRFDERGGDGVGQTVSPLDLLHTNTASQTRLETGSLCGLDLKVLLYCRTQTPHGETFSFQLVLLTQVTALFCPVHISDFRSVRQELPSILHWRFYSITSLVTNYSLSNTSSESQTAVVSVSPRRIRRRAAGSADWSRVCSCSTSRTCGTCQPETPTGSFTLKISVSCFYLQQSIIKTNTLPR